MHTLTAEEEYEIYLDECEREESEPMGFWKWCDNQPDDDDRANELLHDPYERAKYGL